jgi:hypothetical protein
MTVQLFNLSYFVCVCNAKEQRAQVVDKSDVRMVANTMNHPGANSERFDFPL